MNTFAHKDGGARCCALAIDQRGLWRVLFRGSVQYDQAKAAGNIEADRVPYYTAYHRAWEINRYIRKQKRSQHHEQFSNR